ncbi:MAG TPA: TonB-dependent receptor [Caulobacteraceae bacterium]|nr:TonB-dependent receptor [Caulobacteraceae bacterium]
MPKFQSFISILLASSAGATLLASQPAAAADASSTTVGELVVTATRRVEPLHDVPTTVTAISGDLLKNLGVADMKTIVEMVPNAVLPNDPENFETYINIRGIRQADINAEPNFGLYRNGIYSGGERANLGAQVDVDRVEILSGPQSGLYGRDAVGGVVNVIFATPTFDGLHGYAIASYGNWERSELQGAVNVPITSNFAIRAAGWWFEQKQGQLYDISLNQYIDRYRDVGGRLSARWDATDKLSILWMAEAQDRHAPSLTAFAPNGITAQFGVNCCGFPSTGPMTFNTIQEDTPNVEHWAQTYLSQDITYDTHSPWGVFEVQAAYRNYHLYLQEDQDHTAFGPETFPMDIMQVQYRNERMHNFYVDVLWKSPADQRLSWILGADYFNEAFKFDRIFAGSVDFTKLNTPFAGPGFTYGNLLCSFLMAPYDGGCEAYKGSPGEPGAGAGSFPYLFPAIGIQSGGNAFGLPGSEIDTEGVSGFATVTYNVTPQLKIRGDIRYDWLRKHLNYSQGPVPPPAFGATATSAAYLDPLFAQIFPPFSLVDNKTFTNVAPSVNVQYTFNPNVNVYALFATGFRAGGYNVTTTSPAHISYNAEKAYSGEIGTKTLWLDGRLSLNADVFYMRQTGLIEPQPDTSAPSFLGLYFLSNVGTVRTWGAELQGGYHPVNWLNFGLSVGWLDDKFVSGMTSGPSGGLVPLAGAQVEFTRHWTIDLSGGLDRPLTDRVRLVGDFNLRLEYGGVMDAARGGPPTLAWPDFNDLDADAGFAYGNTRLLGYVTNAFDRRIPQFLYSDGIENFNTGRTFGVRIETKF